MKIVILDGQTETTSAPWRAYLLALTSQLEARGYPVRHFVLKDMDIHHCTGCFGCWVKTPSLCELKDDAGKVNREVINADFVLWASPLVAGFPSFHLKKMMDRTIPLIHPYFELVNGEEHHQARYSKYPLIGLLIEPMEKDGQENGTIVSQLFSRSALNFKTRLCFAETTSLSVDDMVEMITTAEGRFLPADQVFIKRNPDTIQPPSRLLAINGSSRGEQGNTPIILQKIMDGFRSHAGNTARIFHLSHADQVHDCLAAFHDADCAILGFPLYTDAMPGIVKEFIEMLEQPDGIKNIPMGFEVHSGFPEALHSRYVEQYLMAFAGRLHSPYLGTIVHGGSEGLRTMPERMNQRIFDQFNMLGSRLATDGNLDAKLIKRIAGMERYQKSASPFIKLINKTAIANYWDRQLKENGAFSERFAQPYVDQLD